MDISRLYSPIIVIAVFGVAVVPLLGLPWLTSDLIVGVAYNLFTIVVFCMLSHIAYRTDLPSTSVFGVGRGASGLGTTLGWALGSLVAGDRAFGANAQDIFSIVFCFILVFVAMVLLKEGTIEEAIMDSEIEAEEGNVQEAAEGESADASDLWLKACKSLCEQSSLSRRECEVLLLLGRGRTIDNIAEELTISFNTAKTHVKHIYTKTGVHTRSDLMKLIEDNMQ